MGKFLGTLNLVGLGHLFRPQIQIWKDLGMVSLWSPFNNASPQGRGIGLEEPPGPWKAYVNKHESSY